jgi:8-oxo-dGTP diphosphatase
VHTPVLATLAYVLSPNGLSTLLMHRNKRPDDIHYGKYVGLGGRLERDEHITDGAIREIQEESGLVATGLSLRGTVSWPGFGKGGQDWFGFVFRVDSFTGQAHGGNQEGTLQWVPIKDLPQMPMWKSDFEWLPMVFDADPRQFHGVMPYHEGEMVSWNFQRS